LKINPAGRGEDHVFLGKVLAKSVYESILVEPVFSIPFLKKLLNKSCDVDDLRLVDEQFFDGLMKLKSLSDGDLRALGMTFEASSNVDRHGRYLGSIQNIDLIPNGSKTVVTSSNVLLFIFSLSHHKLNTEPSSSTRSFLDGFRKIIPASYIKMFSAKELQKVIAGETDDVNSGGADIRDLKNTIVYAGGYHPSQPIVQWLWETVESFTLAEQRLFLKFVTSCSRRPLLGFKSLVPVPCVQKIFLEHYQDGDGNSRLPTSATCMNLLKLPCYTDKQTLREKLLYAINAGGGFELS
jgi:ubiquitin-protein ligase E3 C